MNSFSGIFVCQSFQNYKINEFMGVWNETMQIKMSKSVKYCSFCQYQGNKKGFRGVSWGFFSNTSSRWHNVVPMPMTMVWKSIYFSRSKQLAYFRNKILHLNWPRGSRSWKPQENTILTKFSMAVFKSWTGRTGPADSSNTLANLSRVFRRYFQEPSKYVSYGKWILFLTSNSDEYVKTW